MKQRLLIAAAFGVSFAVTIALVAGGVILWIARPKPLAPWNAAALTATLAEVDAWQDYDPTSSTLDGTGMVAFTYLVQNRTDRDYSTTGSSVVAMVRKPDGLGGSTKDVTVGFPIFIPAGQRVAVTVSIPYGQELGAIDQDTDVRQRVREKLPRLAGFVLFDRTTRYQINLPKP